MSLFLSSFSCRSPSVTFFVEDVDALFVCKMKKSEQVFYQNLRESPAGCQRSTAPSPCTEGKTPPLSLPRGPKDHRREGRPGRWQFHSDQPHHLPFCFLPAVYQCGAVLQTWTVFASLQVNKLAGEEPRSHFLTLLKHHINKQNEPLLPILILTILFLWVYLGQRRREEAGGRRRQAEAFPCVPSRPLVPRCVLWPKSGTRHT